MAIGHAFLPAMLDRGAGATFRAQGMAAVRGMLGMSGPGPVLAAQRNYLQSPFPDVDPALLADLLWAMREEGVHERLYPEEA